MPGIGHVRCVYATMLAAKPLLVMRLQSNRSNFTYGGWAPFGVRGVWNGASLVFFSYIGFDAIATTAEEVPFLSHDDSRAPVPTSSSR